jgi:hypothetical protein
MIGHTVSAAKGEELGDSETPAGLDERSFNFGENVIGSRRGGKWGESLQVSDGRASHRRLKRLTLASGTYSGCGGERDDRAYPLFSDSDTFVAAPPASSTLLCHSSFFLIRLPKMALHQMPPPWKKRYSFFKQRMARPHLVLIFLSHIRLPTFGKPVMSNHSSFSVHQRKKSARLSTAKVSQEHLVTLSNDPHEA